MKIFKEPLVHFILAGAAVFALFLYLNPPSDESEENEAQNRIHISESDIDLLRNDFTNAWMRMPTQDEMQLLIDERIKEEVYYREALALGLDKDDPVIRRHLREKMEFLTNDIAVSAEPTTEQLEQFMADNPEQFQLEPTVTLKQVFFHKDTRGASVRADAEAALKGLQGKSGDIDVSGMGDSTYLAPAVQDADLVTLQRTYGRRFADAITDLEQGVWHGPIASGFGEHLVFIESRQPARMPTLAEIREDVQEAWQYAQQDKLNQARYDELKSRYTISVEGAPRAP